MGNKLKDCHHFKGNDMSRFEKVERKVIELTINSSVPDAEREDSKIFEVKHASGCTQIARILAQKRKLNIEISDTVATLHSGNKKCH